jgi:hypothetical protein
MGDETRSFGSVERGAGAAQDRVSLAHQEMIEQLNRGYICPPDTGPAWRAAYEAGVDMGLLDDTLRMTPSERLREHQRALNLVLAMIQATHRE